MGRNARVLGGGGVLGISWETGMRQGRDLAAVLQSAWSGAAA
jgi:hypothetical protein